MAVLKMLNWRDAFEEAPTPIKWPQRRSVQPGTVYFIGPREGMVKIGFTNDLPTRLKRLQCGSPVPLYVVASFEGTRATEREYHARFKRARQHGEWFLRTIDIEAEIERLQKTKRLYSEVGHG